MEEIVQHRHAVWPEGTSFSVTRVQCDVALGLPAGDSSQFHAALGLPLGGAASFVTLFLCSHISGERRVLRFSDVCCVRDLLADGRSFYIMDLTFRRWEHVGVEVGAFTEGGEVSFYARDVEDITDSYERSST
jgi:hypothetical protein